MQAPLQRPGLTAGRHFPILIFQQVSMTLPFQGDARHPGPMGISPGLVPGRVPGPIGLVLWDKKSNAPAQGNVTKAAKMTKMPPPTKDSDSKDVHVVTLPLFNSSKNIPSPDDVMQAPGIANCPIAAMLAALAFTATGQTVIQGMVSETAANVETDLSEVPPSILSNPPAGTTISSSRFFTVKLSGGSFDVSDVLYTDDHDSGWSPLYLRDPNNQAIWASVIEKALAVKLKSYENFDALDINANDFWEKLTGVKPGQIEIKDDTPLATITAAAKDSVRVPSIAASKADSKDVKLVSPFHGFAMMGLQGAKIQLYDAAKVKKILLTPAEFRHDFLAILYRK